MSKNPAIPVIEFYTDEILDDNFHRIIDFNNDVLDKLEGLLRVAAAQDTRINALENINLVVKTKSGKLLPFLVGAGVGIYIYRNRQKLKKLVDDNRQKNPDFIVQTDKIMRPNDDKN